MSYEEITTEPLPVIIEEIEQKTLYNKAINFVIDNKETIIIVILTIIIGIILYNLGKKSKINKTDDELVKTQKYLEFMHKKLVEYKTAYEDVNHEFENYKKTMNNDTSIEQHEEEIVDPADIIPPEF